VSNDFKDPWGQDYENVAGGGKKNVSFKSFVLKEKEKEERGGKGGNTNNKQKNNEDVPNFVVYLLVFLIGLWLISGMYKIETNQQGIVLYFGKFYATTNPGLNYMLPTPIGKLYKISVTNINKEEFGFRTGSGERNTNVNDESLMLTGDENIVDIDFEVQWRVKDAKNFLFKLQNPTLTIRMATESAMREIIAMRKIDDVLASKKFDISEEVLVLLQNILDSYNSGIEVLLVQLLRVDPPVEVIEAFRDVQTAKADKERKINEAETHRNDVIPKTRGEVESIIKEAEGYRETVIANAEGEAINFAKIYNEYKKNPSLTRKRIYLETMEEVMENVDKIIVDEKVGSRVLQHLELNTKEK
jgi:membrane protease subunit HflK